MENLIEIEPSYASPGALAVRKQRDSVSNGKGVVTDRWRTLDELVSEIRAEAREGDERLLATAMLVRELRHRIQAGEAGVGVKWTEWGQTKFQKGATWLNELNAIASAKDPSKALAHYRQKAAERQKRRNDRRNGAEPDRRDVIELVRSMKLDHVRKVRQHIRYLTGA